MCPLATGEAAGPRSQVTGAISPSPCLVVTWGLYPPDPASWKVVTAQSTHTTTTTMLPLLLLSALLAAASGQAALEPYMLGKFELETSNGFEDFMTEIGVGFLTRKVCSSAPV